MSKNVTVLPSDLEREIESGGYFLIKIQGEETIRQVIKNSSTDFLIIDPIKGTVMANLDGYSKASSAVKVYANCNGDVEILDLNNLELKQSGVIIKGNEE